MASTKIDEEIKNVFSLMESGDFKAIDALWATQPPDKTSTLLVEDLKAKYPDWVTNRKVSNLIQRAEAMEFDDFHGEGDKTLLNENLLSIGANDLAKRVRDGVYD